MPGQRTSKPHTSTSGSPTILRFVRLVQSEIGSVRCCAEAGACGFELRRALTADGLAVT